MLADLGQHRRDARDQLAGARVGGSCNVVVDQVQQVDGVNVPLEEDRESCRVVLRLRSLKEVGSVIELREECVTGHDVGASGEVVADDGRHGWRMRVHSRVEKILYI